MKQRRRRGLALSALGLILMVGGAAAAEPRRQGGVSHRVITIDREQVHPSALSMKRDDVLEFVNYSAAPMIVFIRPHEPSDMARCHVAALGAGDDLAPDAFIWAAGYQPAAIIPPGRFANICSLAPGRYVFVTREVGTDAAGPMENAGIRGTVTVE